MSEAAPIQRTRPQRFEVQPRGSNPTPWDALALACRVAADGDDKATCKAVHRLVLELRGYRRTPPVSG